MDLYSTSNLEKAKQINRGDLLTEQNNAQSINLDSISTSKLVDIFVEEDIKPQKAVSQAKEAITKAIDQISQKLKLGGRLFYIGAGTSGRLGVLDAAECPPTFCTPPDLVQALIAGGLSAFHKSSENMEDNILASISELKEREFSKRDCIVGITAGGTTPYVVSALDFSKKLGALIVLITCVPDTDVDHDYDIIIRLITGPELISGSTRLKAATATKMTLNIISTGVMVKLGKIYKNKMVDVAITNNKLLDRSIRILKDILGINFDESVRLLKLSKGSTKRAILMKLAKLTYTEAINVLDENDQSLRKCLNALAFKKLLD